MNYTKLRKIGIVVAAMLMTTSLHAYNEFNALRDCDVKIAQSGQYNQLSNQKAVNRGHNSYTVTGKVKSIKNKRTHGFTCNIRHKEVVSWHVNGSHPTHNSNSKSNNATAAAVGVGILAIAAIAASSNNKDSYANHATGGDPFADMKYIKRQCKKNIRHHINKDHGRVEKIRLESAYLHNRKLTGRGYVVFERGGERSRL